jgi:predicted ATPase
MTDSGEFDARPVRAFLPGPDVRVDETVWPASVPALAQVLRDGIELPAGLTALLHDLAAAGSQLVVATHSPVLAAVPGARVLELGPWGIRPASWEDLSLVVAWRQFMRDPRAFFRHLI